MKGLAAVAMAMAVLSVPALAQHGGGHAGGGGGHAGGFSGGGMRSAPSFHGSGRPAPAAGPSYGANRSGGYARRAGSPQQFAAGRSYAMPRTGAGSAMRSSPYRAPYHGPVTQEIPYRAGNGTPNRGNGGRRDGDWRRRNAWNGYVYGVGVPWVNPYAYWPWYGWDDDTYFDDENDASAGDPGYSYGDGSEAGPPNDPGYPGDYGDAPAFRPQYAPYAYGAGDTQYSSPPEESGVMLLFKDGRPPLQVHNYLLSRSRIVVLDGAPREIPMGQIDVAGTEKANLEAGTDFQFPTGVR